MLLELLVPTSMTADTTLATLLALPGRAASAAGSSLSLRKGSSAATGVVFPIGGFFERRWNFVFLQLAPQAAGISSAAGVALAALLPPRRNGAPDSGAVSPTNVSRWDIRLTLPPSMAETAVNPAAGRTGTVRPVHKLASACAEADGSPEDCPSEPLLQRGMGADAAAGHAAHAAGSSFSPQEPSPAADGVFLTIDELFERRWNFAFALLAALAGGLASSAEAALAAP